MHLYTQNAKATHFRDRGDGWFRTCWDFRIKGKTEGKLKNRF